MSVRDNIINCKKDLPEGVRLVAVSKFHSVEDIQEAYDAGHKVFGESRMQEVADKQIHLPSDIEWHFIGHLQRNKVKSILPYIHTIHSVDSVRLFEEIAKQATDLEKSVCCLLQIHVATEESKYGFSLDECRMFLKKGTWKTSNFAYIGGIMGMATNTDDKEEIRQEFRLLRAFYDEIKSLYFKDDNRFCELSMGMSGDYRIAIKEGATLVRIGSSIFGDRNINTTKS